MGGNGSTRACSSTATGSPLTRSSSSTACGVITPLRTAFDLARLLDLVEGVVAAVDALANRCRFHPDLIPERRCGWTWRGPS
ncbi:MULTISPECIES: hypothetical protein [unclassified Pseudonocardia]|uniref:hypothetical protein n=1 Tax=unclassified Pseudonocardia TaxID=2619320 RepID=UPI00096622B8|nr:MULTISPECIES: hypothetical protein [unclassified Pseudonocardia]MBN9102021.1 hypothetical protein [Pseudonocardia sp.]OJY47130.1 MAG: hypothetical protein BGP03_11415 [Pseudonocardia sp. 73-21]